MSRDIIGRKHVYLYNCLRQLDEENPIDLSSLDKRVEFQKKVYLLKALGVPLNYKYGSYIKGPYSPDLAKVGFDLFESPEEILSEIRAPIEEHKEAFQTINDLIKNLPDTKTHAYWLELISSLHFLRKNAYPRANNWSKAEYRLNLWKPKKFSKNDIKTAIDIIKKYKLMG